LRDIAIGKVRAMRKLFGANCPAAKIDERR
jgi:hypothetical protein